MSEHYLPLSPGDNVLIDLGGYGLEVHLDEQGRWYDVDYVGIKLEGGDAVPAKMQADVVVTAPTGVKHVCRQARRVRVWRHGPQSPSQR